MTTIRALYFSATIITLDNDLYDESRCRTEDCEEDPNDGEGWSGFCGNRLLGDAENHHRRGAHDADDDPGEPDGRISEMSPIIGKPPGALSRQHRQTALRAPRRESLRDGAMGG